jgi:DNA-directed RNA polymerase subunit alpha
MVTITALNTIANNDKTILGSFLLEPLEIGQGITLGNSLRRTLLNDLVGIGISGARFNNIKHEFSIIDGVREDLLEIIMNLKDIIFKPLRLMNNDFVNPSLAYLNIKGPSIITSGLFYLPENVVQIVNPELYICTVVNNSNFYVELDLEQGKNSNAFGDQNDLTQIQKEKVASTLKIEPNFSPIKNVSFKVKLIHDSFGNIKESLILEILTNGSITPKRSLFESIKILLNLYTPLLLTPEFLTLSRDLSSLFHKYFELNQFTE